MSAIASLVLNPKSARVDTIILNWTIVWDKTPYELMEMLYFNFVFCNHDLLSIKFSDVKRYNWR